MTCRFKLHPCTAVITQLIMSRLQDIFGKDTTYDFDYIKSLKSGPVEDAGYEGLPKVRCAFCFTCLHFCASH